MGWSSTTFADEEVARGNAFQELSAVCPELARRSTNACLGSLKRRHRRKRFDGPHPGTRRDDVPGHQIVYRCLCRLHTLSLRSLTDRETRPDSSPWHLHHTDVGACRDRLRGAWLAHTFHYSWRLLSMVS